MRITNLINFEKPRNCLPGLNNHKHNSAITCLNNLTIKANLYLLNLKGNSVTGKTGREISQDNEPIYQVTFVNIPVCNPLVVSLEIDHQGLGIVQTIAFSAYGFSVQEVLRGVPAELLLPV